MISTVLERIRKSVGTGGFNGQRPIAETDASVPRTMRELLVCSDTSADRELAPCPFNFDAFEQTPGRLNTSDAVISPAMLIPWEPAAPPPEKDYRNMATICRAFYAWLTGEKRTVNIDHSLNISPWPLLELLEYELNDRGTGLEELLWHWDLWEEIDEVSSHEVYIPVWDMQRDDESVPMVEFLHRCNEVLKVKGACDINWPEEVYEDQSFARAKTGLRVFIEILKTRRWSLLPAKWAEAMAALQAYPHWPIGCWEMGYDWWVEPTETADDISHLFDCLEKVQAMFKGVLPLLFECSQPKFWTSLIEALIDAAKKHPELIQNQPLMEVLGDADEKIKIKL